MKGKDNRKVSIEVVSSKGNHHHHYVWFDRYYQYQPALTWCIINIGNFQDFQIHTWTEDLVYDKRGFSFLEREDAFKFMIRFGGHYVNTLSEDDGQ